MRQARAASRWLMGCALWWPLGGAALPLHEYYQETWTSADGLPHNSVLDIEQTSEGYLWIATWEGAVRLGGQRLDVFDEQRIPGLPDRGISELGLDSQGQLLLGTARGGWVRRRQGRWQIIPTDLGGGAPAIYSLLSVNGQDYLGTAGNGLLQRSDEGWVRPPGSEVLAAAIIYAISTDGGDGLWLGADGGLLHLQAGRLREIEWPGRPATAVRALSRTRQHGLVVGSDHGLFRLQEQRLLPLDPALPEVAVESLLEDSQGQLWIGTSAHGLLRLGAHGLESLGLPQGLPNARVSSLFQDREGSVWVGTVGGLLRLREAPIRTLTQADGLPDDYVRTLLEAADGSVYIGSSRGLSRYRDGRIEPLPLQLASQPSILSLAAADDGGLWIGSYYAGLLHWHPQRPLEVIDAGRGMPSHQVRAVLQEPNGDLWAATTHGLARLRQQRIVVFGNEHGLGHEDLISLHRDRQGDLWVGSMLGLSRRHGDRFDPVRDPALAGVQRIMGFSESADGSLWVASDRGVLRLREGRWARAGTEHGLALSGVFAIEFDDRGGVWLSGNRGLLRLDRDELEAVLDGRRPRLAGELFTEADGMASAQANGAAGRPSLQRGDGALWFATAKGIATLQPARIPDYTRWLPNVVLEGIWLDGVEQPLSSELQLAAGTQRLQLRYAALSFQAPGRVRFRYRLDGFDRRWIETTDRMAQFTNLPPGRYRFRASAAHPNGRWSPHEARLDLEVAPLWWQRWPLQLLLAALLLLTGWLLERRRMASRLRIEAQLRQQVDAATADLRAQTERLQEQNLELDAYAHTVAHDLKTPLTTLVGLSRLLGQMSERMPAELLRSTAERIHATASKMALIIDALLLLSRLRTDGSVPFVAVDNRRLVEDACQRLQGMIDQRGAVISVGELPAVIGYAPWLEEVWVNYLSNALKYGGDPPRIEVFGELEADRRVRLCVRDHGPGLDPDARLRLFQPFTRISEIAVEGHGLGLSIVQRIVERMGGEVGCDSWPGEGSCFWLRLPGAEIDPTQVAVSAAQA